jgi:predicted RNA-binding protein YlqC (UPF0109 family)
MQELLEKIVKGIVNNPDQVSVVERESVDFPGLTILEITVADDDKGILIGRKGRTINAIRDIMTISAIRNEKKIKVLVKEDREKNYNVKEESEGEMETKEVEASPEVEDVLNDDVEDVGM